MDAHKILNMPKEFTLDQLKERFRKLSMKTHPDRCGGDATAFNIVSEAFKILYNELKKRESDKPHDVLKAGYDQYVATQNDQGKTNVKFSFKDIKARNSARAELKGDSLKQFNEIFEKTRLEESQNHGYSDFMAKSSKTREDISIPKNVGGMGQFNETFEQQSLQQSYGGQSIEKYNGPVAMALTTRLQFDELGGDEINDFSGGAQEANSLQYTDYMKAYTMNRLFNPKDMQVRPEYKNMGQLEMERSQRLPFLDPQDMLQVERQRVEGLKAEDDLRSHRVRERDDLAMRQFEVANRLLLR